LVKPCSITIVSELSLTEQIMTALPSHRRPATASTGADPSPPGLASHLLLRAFCDELARCGLRVACTSPGSRNTPILLALARERRIRCFSHLDERCAAFFALGAAKASGVPAAVTCTSGTAAANLLPAVIEAYQARVPLILLTADRPPELREVGAGQAIDQLKLYGDAVKWFFELDAGEATPERLRWARALACRAFFTARDGRPGPVHLNVPLREPLAPGGALGPQAGGGGRPGGAPWVAIERPTLGSDPSLGPRLAKLSARARVPLLADPLSGARLGTAALAHYDLLLREPRLTGELVPELVVRIGELPTSKPLRAWLAALRCPQVSFAADEAWSDPDATLSQRTVTPLGSLLDRIAEDRAPPDSGDWLQRWRAADGAVAETLAPALSGPELSEPAVAALLARELPAEATLFVASSMPVRDLESFAPVREQPLRVLANRGANGIDGTVSSAFGVAAVSRGPVVLLVGDVALAHDLGGLLAARRSGLALTIVLVNNDGGGIFHFLPVAGERDAFEEHVATPHGLRFEHAAALYGCAYRQPRDLGELHSAVAGALEGQATSVIEVRTERRRNRERHRELEQRARAALAAQSSPSELQRHARRQDQHRAAGTREL
jgi:2-succinyl-5-enolpyruvyl-6-hydroxy-3-cyclohexene-1-carboxylate synthase